MLIRDQIHTQQSWGTAGLPVSEVYHQMKSAEDREGWCEYDRFFGPRQVPEKPF